MSDGSRAGEDRPRNDLDAGGCVSAEDHRRVAPRRAIRRPLPMASAMLEAEEPMPHIRALRSSTTSPTPWSDLGRCGRGAGRRPGHAAGAASGYAHLVMDLFARVSLRRLGGALRGTAAMLAGSSAQIKRDRDLHPDASEIGMIEDTRQQNRTKLRFDRVGALMRRDAAMAVEHVLRLAWTGSGQPLQARDQPAATGAEDRHWRTRRAPAPRAPPAIGETRSCRA